MEIEMAGIAVEVIRKRIKHMYLRVLPPDGRVRVSAPLTVSAERIAAFVQEKAGWIARQQETMQNQPAALPPPYPSGERLSVWGKPYRLTVTHDRKRTLVLSGEQALLTVREGDTAARREAFVREWYRARLKEEIARQLPRWEAITGLHPSGWQTKYMTTRWGTCNTHTGKIWLNVRLAQKPPECLAYVLLHELAHLRVANHGPAFTAMLDAYMPSWREIKRRLNEP